MEKSFKKAPHNILLIQLGDIGDVVLSFSCARALKETFPEANIVFAVRDKACPLAALCTWASDVISISTEKRGILEEIVHHKNFFFQLRRFKFDVAIDLRTGTRGAILAFLSGAKKRISYYAFDGKLWRNKLFTDLVKPLPNQHIIDSLLGLLASFTITTEDKEPQITVPIEKREGIKKLLEQENIDSDIPIIAIQPFSLWNYKNWPSQKFVELIGKIISKYKVSIVITGGPQEKARASELAEKFAGGVYNLAGKTSIDMYAALLQACELLISVDSAGPHIAAAVGTPTVTIYGPASPASWAPRGENHFVIQKDLPCVPCKQAGCDDEMGSLCLAKIDSGEVFKVVDDILSRTVIA
jgi:heptosyltransferase-3